MSAEQGQQLVFTLKNLKIAVKTDFVESVTRMVAVNEVPGVKDHILGVINYHGTTIPALDLRKMIGLEPKLIGKDDFLIIVNRRGVLVALSVDAIEGVSPVGKTNTLALEGVFVDESVYEKIEIDESGIIVFNDLDPLLTEDVKSIIDAYRSDGDS